MFERGDYISFANCGLPYHIGGTVPERADLLIQSPDALRRRFRIDVRTAAEVLSIDRERKQVAVKYLKTGKQENMGYDFLVLSPGAEPARPPIPGVDSQRVFTLRNIPDMDRIKAVVDKETPKHAVIVGGGYIGLEMAEALRCRGVEVIMVEALNQVMNFIDPEMAAFLHQHLAQKGVDLHLQTTVTGFKDEGKIVEVRFSNGGSCKCDMAILAVGVKPEVRLAKEAGLKIGDFGGIVVDEHMATSDPSIFALGDAVEVKHLVGGFATYIPLAGPANRQGRIAADNIFGRNSVYHKTQGTAICKVFDLAVGVTGLIEKAARARNIPCEKIYIHPLHHAGYFPGAAPITLKLLFSPLDGKVLGAQAIGAEGVDKRIDVLATAIRAGMSVYDLENLELSYAPPYGSAKDPVNFAGFVASNYLRGDVRICHTEDLVNAQPGQMLLDVRTPGEFKRGTIPGAINIPLDDLRARLAEIPKDKELLVFCQAGLRGYIACRILAQKGFACKNLTGGYKIYQAAVGCKNPGELKKCDTGQAYESSIADAKTTPPKKSGPGCG
jgi:NADPH-dependent 2,4-dienoyl-CoA reductase/sulfur reductase-like enzyme/rhodanese-related sulfurtransferase